MSDFPGVPAGAVAPPAPHPFSADEIAAGAPAETTLRPLPIALGAGGVIPFLFFAARALSPDVATAHQGGRALIAYGACILSFLGAVHWGFALAPGAGATASPATERARLTLGVLPALAGCAAILLPGFLGSVTLVAGFALVQLAEERAHQRGALPRGYVWLRRGLTVVVVAILATVITMRFIGQAIND